MSDGVMLEVSMLLHRDSANYLLAFDEPLTPSNRVRAAAKWIAVGGPTILGVVQPILGAVASATSGYFLLFDP
jgi:hypothetical protein